MPEIARILRRLQAKRAPLGVRVRSSGDEFRSMLLEVDPHEHRCRLDELHPAAGHAQVRRGTRLLVDARAEGAHTAFGLRVLDIGTERGIHYYTTRLPTRLRYVQRRQHHRVAMQADCEGGVYLLAEHGKVRVQVTDISAGGAGGVVLTPGRLAPGRRYACELYLGDKSPRPATIEVRHVYEGVPGAAYPYRHERFGALLHDVRPADLREIERLVAALERKRLKGG